MTVRLVRGGGGGRRGGYGMIYSVRHEGFVACELYHCGLARRGQTRRRISGAMKRMSRSFVGGRVLTRHAWGI